MAAVALHHPTTIEAALALLAADEGALPLAGGASMVAMMNARLLAPTSIVSLRDVEGLTGIADQPDGTIRIGAMTRHRETASCDLLTGTLRCLRAAAAAIANPPVRNMGTMGGSISLADPAADYPAALVAADAIVEIAGGTGRRHVPVADFFVDWYTTALDQGELVAAIHLPAPRAGIGTYRKLAKVAGDFAIVSVALSAGADGRAACAIGGCGPAPVRSAEADALLSGGLGDADKVAEAGAVLAGLADPVDDVRGSADYRRLVIPRLLAGVAAEAAAALDGAV